MARDKAKDDKYYNCGEDHERNYVSGLYANKSSVSNFLIKKCEDGSINYSTHTEVYELIKNELGYPIPN
jgi:hypothetical protein